MVVSCFLNASFEQACQQARRADISVQFSYVSPKEWMIIRSPKRGGDEFWRKESPHGESLDRGGVPFPWRELIGDRPFSSYLFFLGEGASRNESPRSRRYRFVFSWLCFLLPSFLTPPRKKTRCSLATDTASGYRYLPTLAEGSAQRIPFLLRHCAPQGALCAEASDPASERHKRVAPTATEPSWLATASLLACSTDGPAPYHAPFLIWRASVLPVRLRRGPTSHYQQQSLLGFTPPAS